MAPASIDTDQAYNDGAQAARTGRPRTVNPYYSRCPQNNGGPHKRSVRTGECFLCYAPAKDPERERLRDAWDLGWRQTAEQLRAERAA